MSGRGLLVGLTAASVGVIYGYDLSSIAGARLFIAQDFHLTTRQQELVTTMVVIGQIVGALAAGVIANAIGRKRSTVLLTAGYALCAILGACAVSLPMLLAARLLLGVAIGVAVVVVPVYVAESAPTAVRGSLLTAYQVTILGGIVLGYLVGYLLAGAHAWRWMLGIAAIPAIVLLPLLLRMPDTARWYLLKGRFEDARRALSLVEPDPAAVETQLKEIADVLQAEGGGKVSEMVRRPYLRATVFVVVLGFLVQITGINAIIYYSPTIFAEMGFRGDFALLGLPALVQLAGLTAVFVSLFSVDRLGRRPILLSGIVMMIVADATLMVIFANSSGSGLVLGFGGILLFIVGFNFGFGSLVWVYAGESFPSRLRSLGSSVMLTSTLTGNALIAGFFLTMLQILGGAGVFAVFGGLTVVAFGVVYRYAPETKGRELEEIRVFWENGGRWPDES
ncbi:sugar porter family MFS transporter [Mycobacterium sp. TY814]|uniref:sugar porter family MFS transporter n=1 Tax=unclassified Mycobacterium TaxID=2642494 RepID=UPI00274223FE|nr:sugar porter family MFS transporter [Mycobacterium sp. TY814]MDP7722154.1 sugar porter family MFS transporter [Mycobacterium sp. TY814]